MTLSTTWYLAQLKPNAFERARLNLERQGLQTFMPLREMVMRRGRGSHKSMQPIFQGYIFIGTEFGFSAWNKINNTYGITRLVTFGKNEPSHLPHQLIEGLRARCNESGNLLPTDELMVGDQVRIISGPFAEYVATIETIPKETRLEILFDILGQKKRAMIDTLNIEKVQK